MEYDLAQTARRGTVSEVEAAIGRVRGPDRIPAIKLAAEAALRAENWPALTYLADFLDDVVAHEAEAEAEGEAGVTGGESILDYAVPVVGAEGGAERGVKRSAKKKEAKISTKLKGPAGGDTYRAHGIAAQMDSFHREIGQDILQGSITRVLANKLRDTAPTPHAKQEVDAILERWLIAMVNAGGEPSDENIPGAAEAKPRAQSVYRVSGPGESYNVKLRQELVEKRVAGNAEEAAAIFAGVQRVIAGGLTAGADTLSKLDAKGWQAFVLPLATEEGIEYGGRDVTEWTPRLRELARDGGVERALRVAVRYSVLAPGGQQWAMPQAQIDYLYEQFDVRGEAFASPLNARLYGKPGARYCSPFADTDWAFGAAGDFFAAPLEGNWTVNPPFVEALMERAAARMLSALADGTPHLFFVTLPAWRDSRAYRALRASPYVAAEVDLKPGEYFFEDPAGARVHSQARTLYLALSNVAGMPKARLTKALNHMRELAEQSEQGEQSEQSEQSEQ